MSLSDNQVKIIIVVWIAVHSVVAVIGLGAHSLPIYASLLNACSGLFVIGYRVNHELRIKQHFFEVREIAFLLVEVGIVVISVYHVLNRLSHWSEILAYIFFSIHFIVLLLALIFMMTFKIKKLF